MILRLMGLIGAGLAFVVAAGLHIASQPPSALYGVVAGATITQPFGCTPLELEPYADWCPTRHFHSGVDLAAPLGTAVYSATSGVTQVGYDPIGAGNYVVVRVDRHIRVLYCHLYDIRVTRGQWVDPGQVIGTIGVTGLATGPHLHLEVQIDGRPVDPAPFLAS